MSEMKPDRSKEKIDRFCREFVEWSNSYADEEDHAAFTYAMLLTGLSISGAQTTRDHDILERFVTDTLSYIRFKLTEIVAQSGVQK